MTDMWCECCDDPATHWDADNIPFCDGCWKQLIADWAIVPEEMKAAKS